MSFNVLVVIVVLNVMAIIGLGQSIARLRRDVWRRRV
jgi:hypothetical protein